MKLNSLVHLKWIIIIYFIFSKKKIVCAVNEAKKELHRAHNGGGDGGSSSVEFSWLSSCVKIALTGTRSWKKSAALIWIKCCWWVSIFQVAQWRPKEKKRKALFFSVSRPCVSHGRPLIGVSRVPQLSDKRPTSHQPTFTTAIISRLNHGLVIIPYISIYIYIYVAVDQNECSVLLLLLPFLRANSK